MKKRQVVLTTAITGVIMLALLACRSNSSNSQVSRPTVLTRDQVDKVLELDQRGSYYEDAGFVVPVRNTSSEAVEAKISITASLTQKGVDRKNGQLTIKETWGPLEVKRIRIPYQVDRDVSDDAYNLLIMMSAADSGS